MAASNPPFAGFTAVNGEARRQDVAPISWTSPSQSWRPEALHPDETRTKDDHLPSDSPVSIPSRPQVEPDVKRRRVDAEEHEHDRPRSPWSSPPKVRTREASPEPRGSRVDRDSTTGTIEDVQDREERVRIPSPSRTWNRGSVPRHPQPETDAALSEQLSQVLNETPGARPSLHNGPTRDASRTPDRANGHSVYEVADEDEDDLDDQGDDDQDDGDDDHGDDDQPNTNASKKRKRQFSQRTKTGCWTCRRRKKKCDEGKPWCHNCERGNFSCDGYGPKSITYKATQVPTGPRQAITLHAKPLEHQSYGSLPAPHSHPPGGPLPLPPPPHSLPPEPPGYPFLRPPPPSHEQLPPYPLEGRPPPREHWGEQQQYWQHHPAPLPHPPSDSRQSRYPMAPEPLHHRDSAPIPPMLSHASERWQPPRPSAPPAPPSLPPLPSSFRPTDSWPASSYPDAGPSYPKPRSIRNDSSGSSKRGRDVRVGQVPGLHLTEKQKMLIGKPFTPIFDQELQDDHQHCLHAVHQYNNARRPDSDISEEAQGKHFLAIIDPSWRKRLAWPKHTPPWYSNHEPGSSGELRGSVGPHTRVEAPFQCDYGYNIHLGDRVLIGRGCVMEDSCKITIGSGTIIGSDVKFITQTASVQQRIRGDGVTAQLIGGAITVGKGCFIAANVIILPYRRIGNGAVVGAGSVVVKDVAENTVVAGNPARVVKEIDVENYSSDPRHRAEIQKQNERMQQEMIENAKRDYDLP